MRPPRPKWANGHYTAFAAAYAGQFLVWNYPPTHCFLLPLLPLLAAGVWRELRTLPGIVATGFRKRGVERATALAICGLIGFFGWQSARWSAYGLTVFLPQVFEEQRQELDRQREPRRWIAEHVRPGGAVLSYGDPLDYLYSGRRGYSFRVPPGILRRGDREEIRRFFSEIPKVMANDGVDHVLVSPSDYDFDCPDLTLNAYRSVFKDTDRFEPVFERAGAAVYRVKSKWAYDRSK